MRRIYFFLSPLLLSFFCQNNKQENDAIPRCVYIYIYRQTSSYYARSFYLFALFDSIDVTSKPYSSSYLLVLLRMTMKRKNAVNKYVNESLYSIHLENNRFYRFLFFFKKQMYITVILIHRFFFFSFSTTYKCCIFLRQK